MAMKTLEDLERAFDRGLNDWESGIVLRHAARMGQKVVTRVKRETPVITGNLRRRWSARTEKRGKGDVQIILQNDADYAAAVNNGHRIVNRAGQTTGYKEGRRMLEKGIAAYKEHNMESDLQAMVNDLRERMG